MRLMITDGGPHPADKWASITAAEICDLIQVDEKSASETAAKARIAKEKLRVDLAQALLGHHHSVQQNERTMIEKHGHARLSHSLDPRDHVPQTLTEALDAVLKCMEGTPFSEHFSQEKNKAAVLGILGSHFATTMHIERHWHADGKKVSAQGAVTDNPGHDDDNEHVVAFNAKRSAA